MVEKISDSGAKKPHIVILGGGFGGIYTFLNVRKRLSTRRADITIVNRTNYFLFTPLLHEVATGSLSHHQVVEAIRSIIYKKGATLHVAEVQRIDSANKIVETSVARIPYDVLVVATGASTAFYSTPGAAEHAYVLKNLYDAIKIRNRLITAFEEAVETTDPMGRKKLLTFVLAGGGATGVELAAEMADLFFDTFNTFFKDKISCDEVSIKLVAGDVELLRNLSKRVRVRAQKILTRRGVDVITGLRVKSVDANGVTLSDDSRIESRNIFWVAGVQPNVPEIDKPFMTDQRSKRIVVDPQLRAVGHENGGIFALGDVAAFAENPVPMLAQAAVQAGEVAAANIVATIRAMILQKMAPSTGENSDGSLLKPRSLRSFKYKSKGDLVSLGSWQAVGHVYRVLIEGPIAWFVWRTVYLSKFASWPKRIKIAVDWTVDMFYPRDITKA